jgi:hypothetical protein
MLIRTTAMLAVLMAAIAYAQSEPPPTPGAWVLSVTVTGGFAGRTSVVTLTSEGQVTCRPTACAETPTSEQLKSIADAVESLTAEDWSAPKQSRFGSCHDCSRTTVTLETRVAGAVRIRESSWTGLENAAPALSELVRLAQSVRPR